MSDSDYFTIKGKEKKRLLGLINVANGISLKRTTKPGLKPHKVGVRDRHKKYQWEAFDTEEQMILHAQTTHASFQTGAARAGKVLMSAIREPFLAFIKQTNKGRQVRSYERLFDRFKAAKIDDLKSETLVRDVLSMLDNMGTQNITPGTNRRRRNLNAGGVNAIRRLLSRIGRWCVKNKSIGLSDNPFSEIEKRKTQKVMPDIYTVPELRVLVRDECMKYEIGRAVAILIYTGMRLCECRWLKWTDFDWAARLMRVTLVSQEDITRAVKLGIDPDPQVDDERMKSVKDEEERWIPMEQELFDLFRPVAGTEGYVFSDDFVKMLHGEIDNGMSALCEAWGIRLHARKLHNIRHNYTCMLTEAGGVSRSEMKERLGHSEASNTIDTYLKASRIVRPDVKGKGWNGEIWLRRGDPKAEKPKTGSSVGVTLGGKLSQPAASKFPVVGVGAFGVTFSESVTYNYNATEFQASYGTLKNPAWGFENPPVAGSNPAKATNVSDDLVVVLDD